MIAGLRARPVRRAGPTRPRGAGRPPHLDVRDAVLEVARTDGLKAVPAVVALQVRLRADADRDAGPGLGAVRQAFVQQRMAQAGAAHLGCRDDAADRRLGVLHPGSTTRR
jgi:hypothetical protein